MAMEAWMAKNGRDSDGTFPTLKRKQFYKLTDKDFADLEQIRADHLIPSVNAASMWYGLLVRDVLDNKKYSRRLRLDIAYTMPRKEAIINWGWKNYGREALLALNDIRPISPEQGLLLAQNRHFTVAFMKEFFADRWVSRYAQEKAFDSYASNHGFDFALIAKVTDFIDVTQLSQPKFFARVREVLNVDESIPDNWVRQMVKS